MFMSELVFEKFLESVDSIKLCNSGDAFESRESDLVNSIFPNYEAFWKWFVVPTTFRIYQFSELLTDPCIKRDRFQIANSVCNKYSSTELDLQVELEDNKPLYLFRNTA